MIFDWFRNKDGDAAILSRNIAWCAQYFADALEIDAAALQSRVASARVCYETAGLRYHHSAWAELYDYLGEYPDCADFFLSEAGSGVVVGFELSRAQTTLLDAEGRDYLNLRVHPLRFLTDYHFAAATNSPDLHARLAKLQPQRGYIDQHVEAACAAARSRAETLPDARNEAVLFAQTAVDASRILEGEVLDDIFVACRMSGALRTTPANLLLKAHPHEPASAVLNAIARPASANTYDLLSVEGLRVFALSSSVCHEAAYFPAAPNTLIGQVDEVAIIGSETRPGQYLMMPSNISAPGVWDYILNGGAMPDVQYSFSETPYKTASGIAWG